MKATPETGKQQGASDGSFIKTKRLENEKKELEDRLNKSTEARDKYKRKYNEMKNELKKANEVCGNLAKKAEEKKDLDEKYSHLQKMVEELKKEKKKMDQDRKDFETEISRLEHEKESLTKENNQVMAKAEKLSEEISTLQKYQSDVTALKQEKESLANENKDLREARNDLEAKVYQMNQQIDSIRIHHEEDIMNMHSNEKEKFHAQIELLEKQKRELEDEKSTLMIEAERVHQDLLTQKREAEENSQIISRQTKLVEEQVATIDELKGDCAEMLDTLQQLQAENELLRIALDSDGNTTIADQHQQGVANGKLATNKHFVEGVKVIEQQQKPTAEQIATIEQLQKDRAEMLRKMEAIKIENDILTKRLEQEDDNSMTSAAVENLLERLDFMEEMKDAEISILAEERSQLLERLKDMEKQKNDELTLLMEQNEELAEKLENITQQKDAEMKERVAALENEHKKLSEMNTSLTSQIEKRNELRAKAKKKLSKRLAAYEKRALGSSAVSIDRVRARMQADRIDDSSVVSGMTFSTASVSRKRTDASNNDPIMKNLSFDDDASTESKKRLLLLRRRISAKSNGGEEEMPSMFSSKGVPKRPEIIRVPSDITARTRNYSSPSFTDRRDDSN